MLELITNTASKIIQYIKDDPVRPEIPVDFRVSDSRFIAALINNNEPDAIVCVSLHNFIPATVDDLKIVTTNTNVAVFYTIWSYRPGAGKRLIFECVEKLKQSNSDITRYVTLSPKTEMARKFHLRNGALTLRENNDTINYEYQIN